MLLQLGLLIPIVSIIAVFTFVAVASWAEQRRKEREAYYRHETYRKILESEGASTERVLAVMREEERREAIRRIDGRRLGGLITTAVGAGMMVFLYFLVDDEPVYLAGLIPLLIGLVLIVHGFLIAPRPNGIDPPPMSRPDRNGHGPR